jgi:hypothetical protein
MQQDGMVRVQSGHEVLSRTDMFCQVTFEIGQMIASSSALSSVSPLYTVYNSPTLPMHYLFSIFQTIDSPYLNYKSRDSSVGIATGYGLDDRGVGVRVPVGATIFISPCSPDLLWGPPRLLSNGYRRRFTRG